NFTGGSGAGSLEREFGSPGGPRAPAPGRHARIDHRAEGSGGQPGKAAPAPSPPSLRSEPFSRGSGATGGWGPKLPSRHPPRRIAEALRLLGAAAQRAVGLGFERLGGVDQGGGVDHALGGAHGGGGVTGDRLRHLERGGQQLRLRVDGGNEAVGERLLGV